MRINSGSRRGAAPTRTQRVKGDITIILALGFGTLALLLWLVVPAPPVGFYWDDGWYLMMAEWLSGRSDYHALSEAMLHLRQYPPGYSLLLAAVGAGLDRPGPGFIINAVTGAIAATALMLWMHRTEQFSLISVVTAAALLLLNPVALTWLPTLFSEHVFVLLTVSALWLAAAGRTPQSWVLIGMLVGCALITRSAGLALLLAVAISAAFSNWRLLPWLLLGLIPPLLAGWWLTADLPSVPRYRASLGDILGNLLNPAYLLAQVTGIARGWSDLWGSATGGIIALLVVVPGLWFRIRRNSADAWLVPLTMVMLIVWPFPGHMSRLLWPLMPALLVCAADSVSRVRLPALKVAALAALPLVLALGLYDGAIRTFMRSIDGPPAELAYLSRMYEWTRSEDRVSAMKALEVRDQLLADMERVRELTPEFSCVYSELPALVAVRAKRLSLASPWRRLDELDTHELRCDYYYLMPLGLPGTDAGAIRQAAEAHEILFRSASSRDLSGEEPIGIFFRLNRPQATLEP